MHSRSLKVCFFARPGRRLLLGLLFLVGALALGSCGSAAEIADGASTTEDTLPATSSELPAAPTATPSLTATPASTATPSSTATPESAPAPTRVAELSPELTTDQIELIAAVDLAGEADRYGAEYEDQLVAHFGTIRRLRVDQLAGTVWSEEINTALRRPLLGIRWLFIDGTQYTARVPGDRASLPDDQFAWNEADEEAVDPLSPEEMRELVPPGLDLAESLIRAAGEIQRDGNSFTFEVPIKDAAIATMSHPPSMFEDAVVDGTATVAGSIDDTGRLVHLRLDLIDTAVTASGNAAVFLDDLATDGYLDMTLSFDRLPGVTVPTNLTATSVVRFQNGSLPTYNLPQPAFAAGECFVGTTIRTARTSVPCGAGSHGIQVIDIFGPTNGPAVAEEQCNSALIEFSGWSADATALPLLTATLAETSEVVCYLQGRFSGSAADADLSRSALYASMHALDTGDCFVYLWPEYVFPLTPCEGGGIFEVVGTIDVDLALPVTDSAVWRELDAQCSAINPGAGAVESDETLNVLVDGDAVATRVACIKPHDWQTTEALANLDPSVEVGECYQRTGTPGTTEVAVVSCDGAYDLEVLSIEVTPEIDAQLQWECEEAGWEHSGSVGIARWTFVDGDVNLLQLTCTASGQPVTTDHLLQAAPGTCLDNYYNTFDVVALPVPCDRSHEFEVIGSVDLSDRSWSDGFTSDDAQDALCMVLASSYMGAPEISLQEVVRVVAIYAESEEEWDSGFTKVVCVATGFDTENFLAESVSGLLVTAEPGPSWLVTR